VYWDYWSLFYKNINMKIRELFEQQPVQQTTNTAPGNVVGPMAAGVKPTMDIPVPNTEKKPNTSNTPKTNQPTGFAPSTAAPSAPTSLPPAPDQQIGKPTSQTIQPQAAGQQQQQQEPEDESAQSPGQQAATTQDLQTQMQSLMMKLRQIQGQEEPPETMNPQPGVSG
jgi:hypothetical protein